MNSVFFLFFPINSKFVSTKGMKNSAFALFTFTLLFIAFLILGASVFKKLPILIINSLFFILSSEPLYKDSPAVFE